VYFLNNLFIMDKKHQKQENSVDNELNDTTNNGSVQGGDTVNQAEETLDDAIEAQDVEVDDSEADEADDVYKKLEEAEAVLQKKSNDYLYLMADFDNYRKRVVREKAEIIRNAAERVLKDLLPIVDDFERGLEATKDDANGQQVREGMELIYNKLVKFLDNNGVKVIESTGADFNADLHDAIATIPAPTPELKGKVIDTTTKGYTINDKVLRHAKVVVGD